MNRLLLVLLFPAALFCQPTVSNIHFDGIGDSSARVIFDTDTTFDALRIRYRSGADCAGGTGTVQINGTSTATFVLFGMTENLSGLTPSTTYFVCPEVSDDGGMTYSSGVSSSFATTARGTTTPTAPTVVDTDFPTPSGSTLSVPAGDCDNGSTGLQIRLNNAAPGDTIVVPAGTICQGKYTTPTNTAAKTFTPSNVVTSTSCIAITGHSFSASDEVRLSSGAANSNYLPGMRIIPWGLNTNKGGGWRKGGKYWVNVPDADHICIRDSPGGNQVVPGWITFTCNAGTDQITYRPDWRTPNGFSYESSSAAIPANALVQFHSTTSLCGGLSADTDYYLLSGCASNQNAACVTQVSLSSGGSAVDITSTGTGTHTIVDQGAGTMYVIAAPDPNAQYITITTDGTLPPDGVRIDSSYDGQLFMLRQADANASSPYLLQPGILAYNYRIRGAKLDTGTNTDYTTSTDPRPYCGIMLIPQDSANFFFDQVRIQGPGYPNRYGCATAMFMDGENVGFINSDMRGLDFWKPWAEGFSPSVVSTTVARLGAGTVHTGPSYCNDLATAGNLDFTKTGGTANGTGYMYQTLDCNFGVTIPATNTGTCAVSGYTCTVITGTDWPVSSTAPTTGRVTVIRLATITFSGGGDVTAVGAVDPSIFAACSFSGNCIQGSNAIISGDGPGPYIWQNNYMSGAGLPLHYDDSGGPFLIRGDYTIKQNTFYTPPEQMAGGPMSDGLKYWHRQPIEWKGGQRILVSGNIFNGSFLEANSRAISIAITPRAGGYTTDVNVTNNEFFNNSGAANIALPVDSFAPISKPAARQAFTNNLMMLMNGWTHKAAQGDGATRGWGFDGGYGAEDILINHNTIYDQRGQFPAFLHWAVNPLGGMTITNNFYFYTGNTVMFENENTANCAGSDETFMNCGFLPSYTFSKNVIVPSWSDSEVPSGIVSDATIAGRFPTLAASNFIPDGISVAANISLVKWNCASLCNAIDSDMGLDPTSPYAGAGTDMADVGVDFPALEDALGRIGTITVNPITTTSAVLNFTAPSTFGCSVDYNTTGDFTDPFVNVPNAGGTQAQVVTLTSLMASTQYFYRVNCAAIQPTGNFTTDATVVGGALKGPVKLGGLVAIK